MGGGGVGVGECMQGIRVAQGHQRLGKNKYVTVVTVTGVLLCCEDKLFCTLKLSLLNKKKKGV